MEKVLIHGNRKKEGLTLVETVIALSIVVTVSLATVSIAVYSTNSLRSSANKGFFNHEISTLADFYVSYDDANFAKAMKFYNHKDIVPGESHTFYYDQAHAYCTEEAMKFYLTLDFTTEKTLKLSAFESGGTLLVSKEVHR